MLLGIASFVALEIFYNLPKILNILKKNVVKIVASLITITFIFVLFKLGINFGMEDKINKLTSNLIIVERVKDKLSRADSETEKQGNLWEERGYDKIFIYPEKIIYGSGEGMYERFSKAYHNNEIHATFPSILFYYGILPTLILIAWVLQNIKNMKFKLSIVYIALFLESFTLLNQRQALFWVIILLGSFIKTETNKKTNVNFRRVK
jgi:hypothetical protein